MSYGSMTARYLENEVLSRPKEWLVPLLYEHLISSMNRAAVQIEARDLAGKAVSLDKASSILLELLASLDHERGGDIADRLAALYTYFVGELHAVGRTLDVAHLRRLTAMATELHEAWVQAAEQVAPRNRSGATAAIASVA